MRLASQKFQKVCFEMEARSSSSDIDALMADLPEKGRHVQGQTLFLIQGLVPGQIWRMYPLRCVCT